VAQAVRDNAAAHAAGIGKIMNDKQYLALDEDPDAALAVITGQRKGSKAYAAICLAQAIQRGSYPDGWARLDGSKP
jgi:hypothetical protein